MIVKRMSTLILIGVLLLSGCSTAQKSPKMFVELAKLTESEQELLDLVGTDEDILLFDYTIDSTIKTITIDTLTLNDQKQWESIGEVTSTNGISDTKNLNGRIMISPNKDGSIKYVEASEKGKTSWSSEGKLLDSLAGDGAKMSSRQEDTVEIVYDQPIPLVMFARSTKDMMRSYALSEYQNTALLEDYDAVSVVTITFSQQAIS